MIDWHTAQTLFMAGAVALAICAYIVLDGFDLGIGMLSAFASSSIERDQMINAIDPFWDGNETWLVFGGAILLAMFPLAFSVIMPAVYMPIIVMLLALVFRGVAFEFRLQHEPRLRVWDLSFSLGSFVAAFAQGVVLGALLQGVTVIDARFAGGPWDWLSMFSVMTGIALSLGYALLGATFLFWRVDGELQRRAGRSARPMLYGVLAFIVIVTLWTYWGLPTMATRWFDFPFAIFLAPVPLLTAACAIQVMRKLEIGCASAWPFAGSVGLFLLSFTGLAISMFPLLAPPSVTLSDAAASPTAQGFLLPGIVGLVPLILFRTWLNYRTFARGRDQDAPTPEA